MGGQGGDEDLALGDGDAAVHVAAAQRHVERGRVSGTATASIPVRASRAQTQPSQPETYMMPSTTIGEASNEYVDLPECRPTEPHWKTHAGVSLLDVLLVDLVERAVALPVVGAVVGEPVLRLRAGVEDALVGDALRSPAARCRRCRSGSSCRPPALRLRSQLPSRAPKTIVIEPGGRATGAAAAGGRCEPRAARRRPRRSRRSGRGPRRCPNGSRTSSSPGRRARAWPFPSSGSPAR